MDELKPQIIQVSEEEYEWIKWWVEQPAHPRNRLAKLFEEESPFEDGLDSREEPPSPGTT